MEISGRMEKWEDRKNLVFPHVCLVGGVEKWEDGKLFCLVREKNGKMENVVYLYYYLRGFPYLDSSFFSLKMPLHFYV